MVLEGSSGADRQTDRVTSRVTRSEFEVYAAGESAVGIMATTEKVL